VQTNEQASDELNARVAAKRDAAERGAGRAPDGKFLKKDSAANPIDSLPKAELKKDAKAKAEQPKAADPEVEKIKAEAQKYAARVEELEARDADWEETAERAFAHIEALEAVIEKLRAGGFDERDEQIIALQREQRARELAQERAQTAAQAKAEKAKAEEHAQGVAALRSGIGKIIAEHPGLAPGAQMDESAKNWWRLVMQAHEDPSKGPKAALALAEQYAPSFSRAIGPPKQSAPQARTLAKLGGTGGGAAKDLSPEGIREKYTRRMSA
jgi:colicin import membrane protein